VRGIRIVLLLLASTTFASGEMAVRYPPAAPATPAAPAAPAAPQDTPPTAREDKTVETITGTDADATRAEQIIQKNFGNDGCMKVVQVWRVSDGTLKAQCDNGEDFRVIFDGPFVALAREPVAMRCSLARQFMPNVDLGC